LHARLRARQTPGIPCPLFLRGAITKRAFHAAGMLKLVIARSEATKQSRLYPPNVDQAV
jgi:hypothetical protein